MAFKKRESARIVGQSKTRLSAMEQIDTELSRTVDYGGAGRPLTKAEFVNQIAECETKVKEYNQFLEQADAKSNAVLEAEDVLEEMYSQVLKGAVSEFGADANEIEKLGGTRSSERKPPVRKPNAA